MSMWELVVVLVVLFLVVGPAKLPELARSIGKGIQDLRRNLNDMKGAVEKDDEFVQAVRDAKRTVEEAQESIRTLFDPLSPLPHDDPPPGREPGRPGTHPLIRPVAEARAVSSPPDDPTAAPTVAESPVEAEVWRAGQAPGAAPETPANPIAPATPVAPAAPSTSGRVLVRAARTRPGSGGGTPG